MREKDGAPGGCVYTYDALNRLSNIQDFQQLNYGFTYDNLSRRKTLTRPNNITTSYSYDEMSRLLSRVPQVTRGAPFIRVLCE